MHEALRIVIETLSDSIAVEEDAADALFAVAFKLNARGASAEAETIQRLSRMHRIKALDFHGQIAVLRDEATRRYRNKI